MMRMLFVVIVLSGFVLASSWVDADTKGGQFSYKVDGQTLSRKVGEVRTSEKRNLPISNKGEVNIVATSQRYDEGWLYSGKFVTSARRWDTNSFCRTQSGIKLSPLQMEAR